MPATWNDLPQEISFLIFQHLEKDWESLSAYAKTNKKNYSFFKTFLNSQLFIKSLFENSDYFLKIEQEKPQLLALLKPHLVKLTLEKPILNEKLFNYWMGIACANGDYETVKLGLPLLFIHYKNPHKPLYNGPFSQKPALYIAIFNGQLEIVYLILTKIREFNEVIRSKKTSSNITAILPTEIFDSPAIQKTYTQCIDNIENGFSTPISLKSLSWKIWDNNRNSTQDPFEFVRHIVHKSDRAITKILFHSESSYSQHVSWTKEFILSLKIQDPEIAVFILKKIGDLIFESFHINDCITFFENPIPYLTAAKIYKHLPRHWNRENLIQGFSWHPITKSNLFSECDILMKQEKERIFEYINHLSKMVKKNPPRLTGALSDIVIERFIPDFKKALGEIDNRKSYVEMKLAMTEAISRLLYCFNMNIGSKNLTEYFNFLTALFDYERYPLDNVSIEFRMSDLNHAMDVYFQSKNNLPEIKITRFCP